MNIIQTLENEKLISPPKWLALNAYYLVIMGSVAYGVSNDLSDMDVYGFCIPPVGYVFPHTKGYIHGFDEIKGFDQYQQHHVQYKDRNYDFSIYSIVKYFKLCMDNNPNMVDSLFVPNNCILHQTQVGNLVRENRKLFLHKGAWFKFKGYAYSQLQKIKNKDRKNEKRQKSIDEFGYDTKFAYHLVRLLGEVEEILTTGDLHLDRNKRQLIAIREGEWSEDQIYKWFSGKEKVLEEVYNRSKLQHKPDRVKIKNLLLQCLEIHYGSLDNLLKITKTSSDKKLRQIQEILNEG